MSTPAVRAFGAGRFFGINNVSTPTPMRAITPQDMSIDFKRSTKSLFGERQLAEEVAAGEMSVTGKVTMGGLNARMFGDLIFGDGSTTGTITEADKEAGTIPATGPYTVSTANHTTATTDLGVFYATTGLPFVRVASGPTIGQYSYAAGVYTFAAADEGLNVQISYLYTNTGAGETIAMANQLQGPTGAFTAVMVFLFGTNQNVVTLTNSIATDAGLSAKSSDYTKPTLGFECAVDSTGSLGTLSFLQAA